MTTLAVVALVVSILRANRREIVAAAVFAAFVVAPVLGIAITVGLGAWVLVRRRPRPSSHGDDEAVLAELTALGLSAGLTFTAAASAAAAAVPGDASARLHRAIRVGGGMDTDTVDDQGLMVVVRRALSTGAPLQPAVSGYATTLRNEER
ncbi:MAG: hypothetical protein U9R47_04585, partial [Actinomycetota bacterium]|nr:hypothetical protein [Actinomycetota bacterium]